MPPIQYTGGAKGADFEFAARGLAAGHSVNVESFNGHKETLPEDCDGNLTMIRWNRQSLANADEPLSLAAKQLQRWVSSNTYVRSLLQRNYFQIRNCDSVYAVGKFSDRTDERSDSVKIDGGTAWACQMFYNKMTQSAEKGKETLIPLYFFSQTDKAWFRCKQGEDSSVQWVKMETKPPPPAGRYAGIGSREIDFAGKQAIRNLF